MSYIYRFVLVPIYKNVLIHFVPTWMAPNVITFIGFLMAAFTCVTVNTVAADYTSVRQ
jgi:hypothetical protein